jgi:predicted acylesterase/phospholipase RssA
VSEQTFDSEVLRPAYETITTRSMMWQNSWFWLLLAAVSLCFGVAVGLVLPTEGWLRWLGAIVPALPLALMPPMVFKARRESVFALVIAVATAIVAFGLAAIESRSGEAQAAVTIGSLAAVGVAIYLLRLRGQALEAGMAATLFPKSRWPKPPLLRELPGRTDLVITATNLNSGNATYLRRGGVNSSPWGWSPAGDLKLVTAARASATFPGVFNALHLGGLRFNKPGAPKRISLVDGGVYDNMGTEWLISHANHRNYLVVVNASQNLGSQPGGFDTFGVGELSVFMRNQSIQYDASTAPRRRWLLAMFKQAKLQKKTAPDLRRGLIVRIDVDLPSWLQGFTEAELDDDVKQRATAMLGALLSVHDAGWWKAEALKNAAVATSLDVVAVEDARRLIALGYLTTALQLHVLEATPAPVTCDLGEVGREMGIG